MHCRGRKWGKIGEGVIGFSPQTSSILLFGPWINVQNFIKRKSKLQLCECLQTDRQCDRSDVIIQGSQTRGPRAACGPQRHYMRPVTHYLKFRKIGINSSRFIRFYTYSIFSQRYLSNSRSAILATAGYLFLLVTQQNCYFSHLRLLYFWTIL